MAKERKALQQLGRDARHTFTGIFVRYGTKPGWAINAERTLLLREVCNGDGNLVTDHLWFNLTKGFEALGELVEGDVIKFDARVARYSKGYVNRREGIDLRQTDYKLSFPTRISLARQTRR